MLRSFTVFLFAALVLTLPGLANAEEAKAGSISVKDAWSRATPEGANVGVGYLTITNDGDAPDRLVAAEAVSLLMIDPVQFELGVQVIP